MKASAAFRFAEPVTLIGGGALHEDALAEAQSRAAALIAADGGANRFSDRKQSLRAVIGDLDSLRDAPGWRAALGDRLLLIEEQESTDFEKCLYSVDAPYYLAVGFLGARHDHAFAALHVLLKRADRRIVLVEEEEVIFLAPRRWRVQLAPGDRVSFAPLRPSVARASSGLRWPLSGLRLAMGERIGTSNESVAGEVSVEFEGDEAWSDVLAILERRRLDAALHSLGLTRREGDGR